jgi:hypothetical protein
VTLGSEDEDTVDVVHAIYANTMRMRRLKLAKLKLKTKYYSGYCYAPFPAPTISPSLADITISLIFLVLCSRKFNYRNM